MGFILKHLFVPQGPRASFRHEIDREANFEYDYRIDLADLSPASTPNEENQNERWIQDAGEFQLTDAEFEELVTRPIYEEDLLIHGKGKGNKNMRKGRRGTGPAVDLSFAFEQVYVDREDYDIREGRASQGVASWVYNSEYDDAPFNSRHYCPSSRQEPSGPIPDMPVERQIQRLYNTVRENTETSFQEIIQN